MPLPDPYADAPFAPFAIFGCTMWVTALAYSALVVLFLKDSAPSH